MMLTMLIPRRRGSFRSLALSVWQMRLADGTVVILPILIGTHASLIQALGVLALAAATDNSFPQGRLTIKSCSRRPWQGAKGARVSGTFHFPFNQSENDVVLALFTVSKTASASVGAPFFGRRSWVAFPFCTA